MCPRLCSCCFLCLEPSSHPILLSHLRTNIAFYRPIDGRTTTQPFLDPLRRTPYVWFNALLLPSWKSLFGRKDLAFPCCTGPQKFCSQSCLHGSLYGLSQMIQMRLHNPSQGHVPTISVTFHSRHFYIDLSDYEGLSSPLEQNHHESRIHVWFLITTSPLTPSTQQAISKSPPNKHLYYSHCHYCYYPVPLRLRASREDTRATQHGNG